MITVGVDMVPMTPSLTLNVYARLAGEGAKPSPDFILLARLLLRVDFVFREILLALLCRLY